jgi:hypothetical protein
MCCPSGARAGPFAQYSLSFGFPWNRPPRKRFAPETERVRSSGEEHAPTLPAPGGAGRLLPDLLSAPLPLSPPYLPSSSEASPPFGRPSLRQPAPNPRSTGRSRTAACGGGNRLGGRGLPPPHIPLRICASWNRDYRTRCIPMLRFPLLRHEQFIVAFAYSLFTNILVCIKINSTVKQCFEYFCCT